MEEQIRRLIDISRYSNYMMQKIAQRQASAPDGTIQVTRKNGKVYFYQYLDGETTAKYLNKVQAPLISALAQKRYDKEVYEAIKHKKTIIDQCITKLSQAKTKFDITKIYENFPTELKPLIKPVQTYDVAYAKRWQAQQHETSTYEKKIVFKTKRGEYVRSKSELIIANKLFEAGVPYHYEAALEIKNTIISYPDFLVLNVRTKKEYFWEHFGRMDDDEYLEKTLRKIEDYAKKGLTLGINFIATFESNYHPLNTEHIDRVIKTLLK